MRSIIRSTAFGSLLLAGVALLSSSRPTQKESTSSIPLTTDPKIQVAILLDVSGSMDGLIEQAKAQLWNMVSVMGKAKCYGETPQIEIALYEYGRSSNDSKQGYVKQISGFSADLDQLSKNLFALKTNGGEEYCGHVMYTSLSDLAWDPLPTNYKVIFIAGNEDFLQGNTSWTKACELARQKGVIVNTIYCGDRMQGIKEHWNLSTKCGNGSYTNINQGARMEDIPTPYDSALFTLNHQLNKTYITYGNHGAQAWAKQAEVDEMNYEMNRSVAAKRVAVKGKKALYQNTSWDLVDAYESDSNFIAKVDIKTLPDSLQKKTREQVKQVVIKKNMERSKIRKDIEELSNRRDVYIASEKTKRSATSEATLESEVEKIIKVQAKKYNMTIE